MSGLGILVLCFSAGLIFARGLLPSLHAYQPDLTLNGYDNALVLEPELTDKVGKVSRVEYAFGSSYMSHIPVTASRPDIRLAGFTGEKYILFFSNVVDIAIFVFFQAGLHNPRQDCLFRQDTFAGGIITRTVIRNV